MRFAPLSPRRNGKGGANTRCARSGFSLVELLTVMFIIAVLIAILVPSLNAARNAAKKTSTSALLRTIGAGLEQFKTDNGREFSQTNGYPPSFAHPPIVDDGKEIFTRKDALEGKFPFLDSSFPRVYGAQWLPAMLVGVDGNGYISRQSVPKRDNLGSEPWKWYTDDPLSTGKRLDRRPLYIDTSKVRMLATEKLPGRRNDKLFPDWDKMKELPVIVDAFDQPILYYAANRNGTPTNMVADEREEDNSYTGDDQEKGPAYYYHDDNHGFTGDEAEVGWLFGRNPHPIAVAGEKYTADQLVTPPPDDEPDPQKSFAGFIINRKQLVELRSLYQDGKPVDPKTPLHPVNPDSYLLISAGADGEWGTNDDVTNFPRETE
ncbi:MAG: prepilin-type N-terminal cleavage/methylation domain-containing protein [Phycisphaerae bacterium]|nr:prepilin-type N-terminal cleavage/methylation domain-containing protein [Phycisphaerae bacterium]